MATRAQRDRSGTAVSTKSVGVKRPRTAPKKAVPAVSTKRVAPAKKSSPVFEAWKDREEQYAGLFGAMSPKGRVFTADGEAASLESPGVDIEPCVILQYSPRPERLSWAYATLGLSRKKNGQELLVLWKQQQSAVASKILAEAAKQTRDSGEPVPVGQIISVKDTRVAEHPHWLVCPAEPALGSPDGNLKFSLLLGISEAEFQCTLKVRPDIADGRQVLFEALNAGKVYPVTDPARTCLTRRRDFNKLWENAFRLVRERLKDKK